MHSSNFNRDEIKDFLYIHNSVEVTLVILWETLKAILANNCLHLRTEKAMDKRS